MTLLRQGESRIFRHGSVFDKTLRIFPTLS